MWKIEQSRSRKLTEISKESVEDAFWLLLATSGKMQDVNIK